MAGSGPTGRASRVLIVEDEPSTARLLSFMLAKQGYEVRTASDGRQALTQIEETLPDAVLLDLQIPEVSGLEVLRQLRGDVRFTGLVVIVLTASSFEEASPSIMQAGASAHCTKPIAPSTLVRRLRELGVPPVQ